MTVITPARTGSLTIKTGGVQDMELTRLVWRPRPHRQRERRLLGVRA